LSKISPAAVLICHDEVNQKNDKNIDTVIIVSVPTNWTTRYIQYCRGTVVRSTLS
jgi:hypothetical protein